MRPLLALLVLVMAMSISGISSAVVASMGDDCCADGGDEPSGDHDGRCPPFCHACACSPAFAVPANQVPVLVGSVVRTAASDLRAQPPESPPPPDVFHPPRR